MNKFIHPATQHLNRVAIAIAASHATAGPTAYLINYIERALNSPQSISHAVPKGVDDASRWSMIAKPFVQSGAR